MKPVDPDDAEWTARFQKMKASDEETTPPFYEVWGRAHRRAAMQSRHILTFTRLLPYVGAAAALVLAFVSWRFTTTPPSRSLTESLPPLLPSVNGAGTLFKESIAFADSTSFPSDGLLPFHLHLNF